MQSSSRIACEQYQENAACCYKLDDFVGAKFYCPCALADGNWHICMKESTLEFATVLSPLSNTTNLDYAAIVCVMCTNAFGSTFNVQRSDKQVIFVFV